MRVKLFIFCAFFCLYAGYVSSGEVVCYYASWGATRPGNGKFTPEDIDATLCTQINYAFLGLEDDGRLKILDPELDVEQENLKRVSALKQKNPNLKCLFSIGGAAGTGPFSSIALDAGKTATMAKSALEFIQEYNFDGLDIDWEYPNNKEAFIDLLRGLRNELEPRGYILTAAVYSQPTEVGGYDMVSMAQVLDYVHIMTYDFHAPWSGTTGQNSPLWPAPGDSDWQAANRCADGCITQWINGGIPASKVTIGMAFYGRTLILTDPSNYGIGAPTAGPGEPGEFTDNEGSLGYNEICQFHPNGEVVWDDVQKVPFMHDGNLWIGFDNPQSIKEKVLYAKSRGLAGVMIWSIETDDLHGLCGEKLALLKAANSA